MTKQPVIKNNLPQFPTRKSARLSTFNYSSGGYYFVTICTHERKYLFGEIDNGVMLLNSYGKMVASIWEGIPQQFNEALLDLFIVMPNHIH